MLVNIDDYMIDGHVDQPNWIPPNYKNFIQTYDFDKKKMQQSIVIYFAIDAGYMYHFFNFVGKKVAIAKQQIEREFGLLKNAKAMQFQSAIIQTDHEKAKDYLKALCQISNADVFYAENAAKYSADNIELTNYLEAFSDVYFSYANASGDYNEMKYSKKDMPEKSKMD